MEYDPFQKKAMEYISQGLSVIVSAPTGAGKTAIAEHVIHDCIANGQKVIYTAPIKALSNQKFRDFQDITKSSVGILTGDVTLNAQASIQVMTTEIFRNKVLEEQESLKDFKWVIYDEIHYIDDYERGSVWEESLIFLPDHMNFLGLSATIPNIDELAHWISSIHHKKVMVVKEFNRPVPLHFSFQCQNHMYKDFDQMIRKAYNGTLLKKYLHVRAPRSIPIKKNFIDALVDHLLKHELLPCIYFVFSRRKAESLASEIELYNFLNKVESSEVEYMYEELCEKYDLTGEPTAEKLKPFIRRGIAYHHAGMLPTLKEVVERLFTSRLIKMIFTTETFALGINMPARCVVFDEMRKYYGIGHSGFATLRTRDLYQMAGRAGRRSIDVEGHVICRVDPHDITTDQLNSIITNEPEKVRSQFNTSYATLLNLYAHYGEKLYDIYPKSFHYFQVRHYLREKAVAFMKAKVDILKELGHIENEELTEKGLFASKIYGHELILAELYGDGVLDKLNDRELALLALSAVYEARKNTSKPPISQTADRLEAITRDVLRRVHKLEKIVGLTDFTKRFYFHLSPAMELWLAGSDFGEIMQTCNADEGEMVRAFRMAIQIMHEIAKAPLPEKMQQRIYRVIKLINRDVIDSEKQLRA